MIKNLKKRCIKVLRCSLTTICPQTTSFVLYNSHAAGQFKPTEGLFVYLFFPPFTYFTSHLYCITRFEDEDAICRIKYQVTRINGEGRI